jgi:hypothetical protein
MIYPEMVKTNARYRGPRESRKQTNINRDTTASIQRVRNEIENHRSRRIELAKSIFGFYNEDSYSQVNEMVVNVQAVKGGELG